MMSSDRFIRLVEENGGFEFYQAYQKDVDHILGGKNNTYWYVIAKDWEDTCTKGTKTKTMPAGSTIGLIEEKAFFMQEEKWVKGRKAKLIEDAHPHFHYVYGFGDKGLDVSEKYGVTIAYSDIKDLSVGFHLRYLYTGKDVDLP